MSFEHRSSPARISVAAAAKLPRWIMVVLLLAFILPGQIGRDPWSLEDMSSFGVMWTMANGSAIDWWLPSLLGTPRAEEGPLPFWLGALLVRWAGPWIGDISAARLVTPFWFLIATSALWYSTYRLARRSDAQPVAFAFGGEASPRSYGRMLADVSVLLLLATFGVLVRLHEISAENALLALSCIVMFGLAKSLDQPWSGTVIAGLALGAACLTRGLLPAMAMLLAALTFIAAQGRHRALRCVLLIVLAGLMPTLWQAAAHVQFPMQAPPYFAAWRDWNATSFRAPGVDTLIWLGRNLGWYTWPLWPFAIWTLYSWRHHLRQPHILLPLLLTASGALAILLSSAPSDREFQLAVPGLVILALFGVSSLKRSAEDAIDWFALALFSLALAAIWSYYIAWNTGTPPKMAASITRLAPGVEPSFVPWSVALALAFTLAWVALVVWRVRFRPAVLWRGPLLAASGLTVAWGTALLLFLELIDVNRSYAAAALTLSEQLRRVNGNECVQAHRLPAGTKAMIAYHGGIRFERPAESGLCRVALQRDSRRTSLDDAPPIGDWELAYELTRRARYDEVFRIWVRRDH
jgi:4-amino-4-deoxy-L-arabinose transferase-like glycosyltransferase